MMNSRIHTLLFVFATCAMCLSSSAQNNCDFEELRNKNMPLLEEYGFIKSFPVETTKQNEKVEYSYLLNGGTKYRMIVVDNGRKGERMKVTIRDRAKKVLANNKDNQKRTYSAVFDFESPATGIYFFEVSFEDNRRDCGINILGYQK